MRLPLDPLHDVAPSLLTAHLILSRAAELRHLLDLYSAACHRAIAWDDDADGYESLFSLDRTTLDAVRPSRNSSAFPSNYVRALSPPPAPAGSG